MRNGFDADFEITNIVDDIRHYFATNGSEKTKAIIGISGGKDSTIAAALLVKALGSDRVIGVMMPEGEQNDIEDAREVCKYLHIHAEEINIGPAVDALYGCIGYGDCEIPQVRTNTPARIRMTTLYAVAAIYGGRVINTGNKSEAFVGYTTKYGDLAGDFALLRNYYVRDVIAIGMTMPEIPAHLIIKTPGDGMSGSTDEERFGFTYEALDAFLIDKITPDYLTQREIERRHNMNAHKRCINLPTPGIRSRHEEGKEWHPKPEFWF